MPRVIPKTREQDFETYKLEQDWQRAREKLAKRDNKFESEITNDQVADYLARQERNERSYEEAKERVRLRVNEPGVYDEDSPHFYFRDLVADALARKHEERIAFDATAAHTPIPEFTESPIATAGTIAEVRARLATVRPGVEARDVSSADPGYASLLDPGFLGDRFNSAQRAEASLAAALGLEPLPKGVKEVLIPRFDTGASAAVQATEGTEVSEANVDGGTQASKIAAVSGHVDFSLQAFEWPEPRADISIAEDLGKAIGAAIDAQLVAGSNASGQMLGFANVTGARAVSWVDASPTSQKFVGQAWKAYDSIANGGQGVADPDEYTVVMHPRRLAWSFHNPQSAQSIAPAVPGRIVASGGIRTTLGGGTEDEVYVLVPSELPAFAGPVQIIIDDESLSGTLQIRITAYRMLSSGFGRAPGAISRISGTGLTAPVL